MSEDLERLFYRLFGPKVPSVALGEHRFRPSVDVFETEDEVVIKGDKREGAGGKERRYQDGHPAQTQRKRLKGNTPRP